ncbi:ATP synthase subunit O, mitochondrial [Pistacia vera]|uniref:ATP synthase subunit O, mitochondrial n=1 Tax=Pistacia vera TaxID=55513 RepID=UPI001262D69F|nr:ATP synthase subunit O, mitochondrial [Pistacia vera]
MATAGRIRSSLSLFSKVIRSDSVASQRYILHPQLSKNFATVPGQKEEKVKVPMALFGGTGNYASALFLAAVKANSLEKVETELLDLVEASKRAPTFFQFMKDLAVPADIRVKAINDICAQAKYSETTKNFLVVLAENERLRYVDSIAERFVELTMAHKGEVKVIVTTVIPLPPEEEKDLKETLQDILGIGKKAKVEQKIDPSILGGLVVEFGQKVFDMSIKTRARQMERFLREPANFGII